MLTAVGQIRALIPEERQAGSARRVSTTACWQRAAIRRTASIRRWGQTRFSSAILSCLSRSAPTVSSTATRRMCVSTSTADVLRVTSSPEDMRHVFSYDVIMDGIRTIVARGHVQLSEALAEQVAAHVLEDPRVMRVTVRVEKQELGPGGVGVEIERRRASSSRRRCGRARCPEATTKASPARQERRRLVSRAVVKLGGSTALRPRWGSGSPHWRVPACHW